MAHAGLESRTVEAELDRHAEGSGRLRGVDDFSGGDYLVDDQFGMSDNNLNSDSLRPWVLEAIEIFGVERCVLGANWALAKLYFSYDALIDAYAEILSGFSDDGQTALFSADVECVFRI